MFDSLEYRRLFAISVSGGIATIAGTSSNDVLEVINNSGTLQVRNAAGTVIESVSMSGITRIDVNGGSGNDFIRMGRSNGTLIPGVATILAGNGGNDTLIGGLLNDQLFGAAGNDRLDGRAGRDILNGGTEFDTADYSGRSVPVKVSLVNSSTANDGSSTGDNSTTATYNDQGGDNVVDVEAAIGGSASDIIVGNASSNWLEGGGGNDSIYGGDGIDTLTGVSGVDLAYGEGGDDFFFMTDSVADKFLGGLGTTFAQYDVGPSIFDSAAPSSYTVATSLSTSASLRTASLTAAVEPVDPPDVDVLLTSENLQQGTYTLKNGKTASLFTYTDKGKSKLVPDYLTKRVQALQPDGTLLLAGSELADTIVVTQADGLIEVSINGELYNAPAASVTRIKLSGLGGDDTLVVDASVTVPVEFDGGSGNDSVTIAGSAANDSLTVSNLSGAIVVTGGASSVRITSSEAMTIDSAGGDDTVDVGGNVADAVAVSVIGGDGNDVVIVNGTVLSDTFAVNPGTASDQVVITRVLPASAYSVVVTGTEDLRVITVDGNDTITVGNLPSTVAISVTAGSGNDVLIDGVGNAFLSGGIGDDTLYGGAGSDVIDSGDGNDLIYADDGNDTINAGGGDDIVYGGAGQDLIDGGSGNNILFGGSGNDTATGGANRDIIVGGDGADSLAGGGDDDLIIAGSTSYDNDFAALAAIQAEWVSSAAFSNRVANLNGLGEGNGLNGNYYLRPGGSSNKTVFEDSSPAGDLLTGNDGSDWFFADTQGLDTLTDLSNDDKATHAP